MPSGQKVALYEIRLVCEQVINKLLKAEYFQANIGMGETIPNASSLCTYESIPVVKYKNVSKATLPAYPIKLPLNMGVFMIFGNDDVKNVYVPLQMGDIAMIDKEPIVSQLSGIVGYEVDGMDVIFNKDITAANPAVTKVTMRLVVMDISQYGDYDILPLPSDYEWAVINEVCKFYGVEPNPDKINDPGQSTQNNIPVNQQMMS